MKNNNAEQKTRTFNVTVLSIPIVYDFFGDHDPNGLMYILKEYKNKVEKKALIEKMKREIHSQDLQRKFSLLQ